MDEQDHDNGGIRIASKNNLIPLPTVEQTETYKDVQVNPKLEKEQVNLIKRIDENFQARVFCLIFQEGQKSVVMVLNLLIATQIFCH